MRCIGPHCWQIALGQVRIASTLALWATIDSTAVVTANSALALIPAQLRGIPLCNARPGVELHQHQHIDGLRITHGDDLMMEAFN